MKYSFITFILLIVLSLINPVFANINNELMALYPFNCKAVDISGNERHGNVSGATLTNDRFNEANSAYNFNGINDSIVVSDEIELNKSTTLSLWIKPEKLPVADNNAAACINIITIYKSFALKLADKKGRPRFQILSDQSAPDDWQTVISPTGVTIGNWYHLVGISDGTTIKLYVNAVLVDTASIIGNVLPGTFDLRIGYNSVNESFKGDIDDIRIFSRAISETEIQHLYNENHISLNYSDSDNDGVIDIWDKCVNTTESLFVDKLGCPIDLNQYFTQEDLNQAVTEAITEKNQIITQKVNTTMS